MRGLSRWVMRLITPPLPALSRPSNSTTILAPVLHPVLQLDQLPLQPQQLAEIDAAVDALLLARLLHVQERPGDAIVVDLLFELFVEIVLQLSSSQERARASSRSVMILQLR
jgi:hypothetical protein